MIDHSIRFWFVSSPHISVATSLAPLCGLGKETHARTLHPPLAARRQRGSGARCRRGAACAQRPGRAPHARDRSEPRPRDSRRARLTDTAALRRCLPDEPEPGGGGRVRRVPLQPVQLQLPELPRSRPVRGAVRRPDRQPSGRRDVATRAGPLDDRSRGLDRLRARNRHRRTALHRIRNDPQPLHVRGTHVLRERDRAGGARIARHQRAARPERPEPVVHAARLRTDRAGGSRRPDPTGSPVRTPVCSARRTSGRSTTCRPRTSATASRWRSSAGASPTP